uniref:Uncharacterized protein n=1 Tax=Cacopsylla melanoneura TaxID=428564 RepID=A0A8D8X7L5_9HEMI
MVLPCCFRLLTFFPFFQYRIIFFLNSCFLSSDHLALTLLCTMPFSLAIFQYCLIFSPCTIRLSLFRFFHSLDINSLYRFLRSSDHITFRFRCVTPCSLALLQ